MVKKTGTSGNDVLKGTAAADLLSGFAGNDKLFGFAGDDQLIGDLGNDKLYGGAGNDIMFGVAGADRLDGGDGLDTAYYLSNLATTGVTVSLLKHKGSGGEAAGDKLFNIENITGSNFADALTGDGGNNVLDGAGGNDKLYGGDGNDVLVGGAGADRLDGGAGHDFVSYDLKTAKKAVFVDLLHNVAKGGDAQGDILLNIEGVVGTKFGDFLVTGATGGADMRGLGGDDTISLNGNNDAAQGGDGNDLILARGLDQRAFGEAGNDTIDAGAATNAQIEGGAGDDKLFGGSGNGVLVGGDGNDTLSDTSALSGSGVTVFAPGAGTDTVIGDGNDTISYFDATSGVSLNLGTGFAGGAAAGDAFSGILNANGSSFDDILTSATLGLGHAILRGFDGDDKITLAGAVDQAFGGAGNDTILLVGGGQTASGDDGDDILDASGATGATLFGGAGNDKLTGGTGSEQFYGGDGNDILKDANTASGPDTDIFLPGAGSDAVTGDGNDTIDYFDATAGVTLNLGTKVAGGAAAGDTFAGILNANGSDFDDTLVSSSAGAATILGRKGNDTITLLGASDRAFGGDGNDSITLSGTSETANGDAGDDHIIATGNLDNANGGEGNDTIDLKGGNGLAHGDAGDDIINATLETSASTLDGGAGNDMLTGGNSSDQLHGGAGNDILKDSTGAASAADRDIFLPGLGTDTVTGDGNDTLSYADLAVGVTVDVAAGTASGTGVATSFSGILSVTGSSAGDTIVSLATGAGHAIIQGLGGIDTLTIKGTADQASGGDGNDTIHLQGSGQFADGGIGNDSIDALGATSAATLHGREGNDTLTGSTAFNDFFALETLIGSDTITNFTAGDKLLVELATSGLAGIAAGVGNAINSNNFVSAAGHVATLANAQLLYDETAKDVWYDSDGTGAAAAVKLAHLDNGPASLATTDFFIL
jgi:Ca2+-binding RTX toxin-like protein